MVAYPNSRLPAGIPGTVQRIEACDIITEVSDAASPLTAFGTPVKVVNGRIRSFSGGEGLTDLYGWLVRSYPGYAAPVNDALGTTTPPTEIRPHAVLLRGYMDVQVNGAAAAAKNGAVYIRIAAAAAGKPIGGVEAAADGSNTLLLTNAYFRGPSDGFGNNEIAFKM